MPAVVAAGARKAVSENAALQVFAKSLLDIRRRGVVVALAIKLTGACQLKPGLEVLGNRAVQQGAFGVAGVVDFGGLGRLGGLGVQRGMVVSTGVLVQMMGRALHGVAPVRVETGVATIAVVLYGVSL